MITKLDDAGRAFLANNEGVRLKPYLDSNGTPTIGIGFTWYPDTGKHVTMQDLPISYAHCMGMFQLVTNSFERSVASLLKDKVNQNQFNACLDLAYEIGVNGFKNSTLLRRILAGAPAADIDAAFLMWNKERIGGVLVENKDITARRKRDIALYHKPI